MSIPGRKYEAQSGYRYGFNGKEKDKDINSLTAYDYGFRIYNPAIGKFLSVDPLTQDYPELTPYQFASNTPVQAVDLDGLEMAAIRNGVTSSLAGVAAQKIPSAEIVVYRQLSTIATCHGPGNSEFRVPGYSNPDSFYDWWRKSTL
jgi:RHS repeat-associated protein